MKTVKDTTQDGVLGIWMFVMVVVEWDITRKDVSRNKKLLNRN